MSVPIPASKRKRNNGDWLLCPISLNLPIDPVVADDGHIYEKQSIEKYFLTYQRGGKNRNKQQIISPSTKQPISKRLLPCPQVKNAIASMIENGTITGVHAEDWKKRMQEKKKIEALIKKAELGSVEDMEIVAAVYEEGKNGFQKDARQAYKWYDKARVAGSMFGTAKAGEKLVRGDGVAVDVTTGMMYLGMASGQGSDFAAYSLGMLLADGQQYGVPVNKDQARKLLEKSLSRSCPIRNMCTSDKQKAKEKLNQLVNNAGWVEGVTPGNGTRKSFLTANLSCSTLFCSAR